MNSDDGGAFTKVHFELQIEEPGYPPISIESLNGKLLRDNLVEIDNTPFFISSIALGDTVKCRTRPDMIGLWFDGVEEIGGNKALSIIFLEDNTKNTVFDFLKSEDCYCEYGQFGDLDMLAICVFSNTNYEKISEYLMTLEKDGLLSYAELCL